MAEANVFYGFCVPVTSDTFKTLYSQCLKNESVRNDLYEHIFNKPLSESDNAVDELINYLDSDKFKDSIHTYDMNTLINILNQDDKHIKYHMMGHGDNFEVHVLVGFTLKYANESIYGGHGSGVLLLDESCEVTQEMKDYMMTNFPYEKSSKFITFGAYF